MLTDSFHGTIFSILFQTEFYVFERNEGKLDLSSRISTLLDKFKLKERKYFDVLADEISDEQWAYTTKVIKEERQHTKKYLENALMGDHLRYSHYL